MFTQRFIYDTLPGRPSCHCAMAVELTDGSLLATFYAGAHEGNADVAVLTARLRPGAEAWDAPQVVSDTPGKPEGNSVLVMTPGGIDLYYAIIHGAGWSSVRMYRRRSDDFGETWSEADETGWPVGWLVRNKAVRLSSGRVLFPIYDETDWSGLCLLSDDDAETWRPSSRMRTADGTGCIQPALIEQASGDIIALLRTGGQGGFIWRSVSTDGGETWSECVATELPNPNSGIDAVKLAEVCRAGAWSATCRCTGLTCQAPGNALRGEAPPGAVRARALQSGRALLVYNHTQSGRTPLNLAISDDGGLSWRLAGILEDAPGEYSYPAVLQARNGKIHVLYTWLRRKIRHVTILLDDLAS